MQAPSLKPKVSLRTKLAVGLILFIVVLFASINFYAVLAHRASRIDAAKQEFGNLAKLMAGTIAPQIADSSIDSPVFRARLRDIFRSARIVLGDSESLAFIMFTRPDFSVVEGIARPEIIEFPDGESVTDPEAALNKVAALKGQLGSVMRTTRVRLNDVETGDLVAYFVIGFSSASVEEAAQTELITNGVALLVALILMTVYASVVLGHLVVNPLRKVIDAMRTVQEGELETQVDLRRNDEIGVLGNTFNFMLQGLREREHLKDAFNRYVSRQVYDQLQGGQLHLSGEVREATILFSDIRSFTALSEKLRAEEVVELLNEYFTEMVEIIFKYDGFLNKFIGDAIMAVYNAPLGQSHPELRAVRTAIEMQLALARLNERRQARGQFAIRVGIGINTGPVVAGNIGHEQRLEYTVIGDAVNLAQRIESQTKVTGTSVLISESTYHAVANYVKAEALPPVKVKGKREPVKLFAVQGLVNRQPQAAAQG